MKIKALQDNIVAIVEPKPTKYGSIELPQTAAKNETEYATVRVIDIGPGREDFYTSDSGKGRIQVFVKVKNIEIGDRLLVQAWECNNSIKDSEGNQIVVLRSFNVLAKIEE